MTPPGWYSDPVRSDRMRYWDGVGWSSYYAVQDRQRPWATVGIVTLVLALGAAALSFLLAVATSNACGMFADGCEEYGESADGFTFFVAMLILSTGVAAVAAVGTVVAVSTRHRHESRTWRVESDALMR